MNNNKMISPYQKIATFLSIKFWQKPEERDSRARIGLYGKLPSRGDFLVRDLGAGFRAEFEPWLHASVAQAAVLLGPNWTAAFPDLPPLHLSVPATQRLAVWRAVICPSRDAVGRAFPVACVMFPPEGARFLHLDAPMARHWFESVSSLLQSAVADGREADLLLELLRQVPAPIQKMPGRQNWSVSSFRARAAGDPEPDRIMIRIVAPDSETPTWIATPEADFRRQTLPQLIGSERLAALLVSLDHGTKTL